MYTFGDEKPDEFLTLLRNFKIAIDRTGTNTHTVRINYLRTMLRGKSIRVFYELSLYGNAINNHIKRITEGLIEYSTPLNTLSNQKHERRHAIHKPHSMPTKQFSAQITEISNFPPLFPGSEASKKMPPEELNKIILHAVPNGWSNQSYLQVRNFEMKTFR